MVFVILCFISVFAYHALLDYSVKNAISNSRVTPFAFHLTSSDPQDVLNAERGIREDLQLSELDPKVLFIPAATTARVLERARPDHITHGMLLIGLHLLIYVSAVCAFALMSLREYLIELLEIPETSLLFPEAS